MKKLVQINELIAVWMIKIFGSMWLCYVFVLFGLIPLYSFFSPYKESVLYWSNWIQLWSLPLILVGTNILGRDAEERAKIDHHKLSDSYDETKKIYREIIGLLMKQEELMQEIKKQNEILESQDVVLAKQTDILETHIVTQIESNEIQ